MKNVEQTWNMSEAVILLDAVIATKNGLIFRVDAVKKVSSDLRKMAINQGMEIDQTYRNQNGVSLQMHSMESAYCGITIFKPATKLFEEAVRIYREDRVEYQRILMKAKKTIEEDKTVIDDFVLYLSKEAEAFHFSEYLTCYSEIEKYCIKLNILNKPLFQTTDFETIKKVYLTIERDRFFRYSHKQQYIRILMACRYYYRYIKSGHFHRIKETNKGAERTKNAMQIVSSEQMVRTQQDEQLFHQYSDIYKRVYSILRASNSETSIGVLSEEIGHNARLAVLAKILDNASWSKPIKNGYAFSNEIVDHCIVDKGTIDKKTSNTASYVIDFNKSFDLAYTKPFSFSYFGEEKDFGNTWTDLYVAFFASIYEDYPHLLKSGMSFSKKNERIELALETDYDFMIAPKSIPGTNLMLETNISANGIASKIKFILDLCNVDYENVEINYRKRSTLDEIEEKNATGIPICVTNGTTSTMQTSTNEEYSPKLQLIENERIILSNMEQIILNADLDGMTYGVLKDTLKISMVLTKRMVSQSTKIIDIKGVLIHEEAFVDWENGADALEKIIEKLMLKNNGYISSTQLFEYARTEMSMFLNDNDMSEERAVYDIAQHLFEKVHYHEKTYVFHGKMHISRTDKEIDSNLELCKKYATDQGGVFSFNGLVEYLENVGIATSNLRNQMRMLTEPIFFFYDCDIIVTVEALRIDEDWKIAVKKSLDILFDDVGDHIILRNIPSIWFDRLPAVYGNHPWTPLLLQSVLRFFNKELGARTIQALDGQALDTLHTMLVANDSPIQNFGDVVVSYLLEQNNECRVFDAEELRLLLACSGILHGNELYLNMPKALKDDRRFAWNAAGNQVVIKI